MGLNCVSGLSHNSWASNVVLLNKCMLCLSHVQFYIYIYIHIHTNIYICSPETIYSVSNLDVLGLRYLA